MSIIIPQSYYDSIKGRSRLRFCLGFIVRFYKWAKYALYRTIARTRGASIGKNTIIPYRLSRKANSFLTIGNNCIIESSDIDLRGKVQISDNVIINRGVTIIRASHFIDDDNSYSTKYYPPLLISSYSWLATNSCILPSVSSIAMGSIIGAASVVAKNTEEMGVYSGNPARLLRYHSSVFSELVVPSLKGGDFEYYVKARSRERDELENR